MSFKIENSTDLISSYIPSVKDVNLLLNLHVGEYKYSARSDLNINDWMLCDGRSLLKTEYPSLYATIGNTFGSNESHFNIPDFRGRLSAMPSYNGLINIMGRTIGEESVTLTNNNLPAHSHANNSVANQLGLMTSNGANTATSTNIVMTFGRPNIVLQPQAVTINPSGGNLPHNNMQPTLYGSNVYILSKISDYHDLSSFDLKLNLHVLVSENIPDVSEPIEPIDS
jgi:microcystin-dependent protein